MGLSLTLEGDDTDLFQPLTKMNVMTSMPPSPQSVVPHSIDTYETSAFTVMRRSTKDLLVCCSYVVSSNELVLNLLRNYTFQA